VCEIDRQREKEKKRDTEIQIYFSAIVSALSGSGCEVYLDGGIRMGTDVLKALALGAK
jgi:isopentenyl diphosphate isomerase/L-lactate dehydrogenase-like FMN-dependent dehydrogenase